MLLISHMKDEHISVVKCQIGGNLSFYVVELLF